MRVCRSSLLTLSEVVTHSTFLGLGGTRWWLYCVFIECKIKQKMNYYHFTKHLKSKSQVKDQPWFKALTKRRSRACRYRLQVQVPFDINGSWLRKGDSRLITLVRFIAFYFSEKLIGKCFYFRLISLLCFLRWGGENVASNGRTNF